MIERRNKVVSRPSARQIPKGPHAWPLCVDIQRRFILISRKSLLCAAALAVAMTSGHAQVVGVATLGQGTLYYSVAAAVAGVIQQKAAIPARVQPLSGASTYAPILSRGEIEFGVMNSADVANAFNGVENFNGRKNPGIRLVGVLFSLPQGMAVANDSPAKTIQDLKGMRAPSQFTAQTTMIALQDSVLATGGLSHTDMKSFPVPNSLKGTLSLGDKKVDTALVALGNSASQEVNIALAAHGGIRFLSISDSPEALAAMHKVLPTAYLQTYMPAPGYPGIIGPTRLMAISALLVASDRVPDEIVYKVTKALYENKVGLEFASAAMKSFDPAKMAEESVVPYHPGAEKFYREVGHWPPTRR
jgi:TRAP transporter TAXI family solute receptor